MTPRVGHRFERAVLALLCLPALTACQDYDDAAAGNPDSGPPDSGGASSGGASSGGASSGGASSGGASSGGTTTSTGGASSGGQSSGGSLPGTGGISAGGSNGVDGGAPITVSFSAGARATWEGTGSVQVPFKLSGPVGWVTRIWFSVAGTATGGGVDFTLSSNQVLVPPGATEGTIELSLINDDASEADETISLTLVDGEVLAGSIATQVLSIEDDDVRDWPGANAVKVADAANAFSTNVSDLAYQPGPGGSVLWAIQNGPSKLYRLIEGSNGTFASDTANSWGSGKALYWPGAEKGSPDTEGLTLADATSPALYASTERDNGLPNQNRFSVLRFDPTANGAELTATHEWNLTADIPAVNGANLGLEALTWIPDTYLVSQGFYDEGKHKLYAPADYPGHGGGIFLVGVEATGVIYAYVLDASGAAYHRVSQIQSGFVSSLGGSTVVSLSFDREHAVLWATCDNNCDNRAHVLKIETNPLSAERGRFQIRRRIAHPSTLPAVMNNEGIGFAPDTECQAGQRAFFWVDDSATSGHVLRRDTIPCGAVF